MAPEHEVIGDFEFALLDSAMRAADTLVGARRAQQPQHQRQPQQQQRSVLQQRPPQQYQHQLPVHRQPNPKAQHRPPQGISRASNAAGPFQQYQMGGPHQPPVGSRQGSHFAATTSARPQHQQQHNRQGQQGPAWAVPPADVAAAWRAADASRGSVRPDDMKKIHDYRMEAPSAHQARPQVHASPHKPPQPSVAVSFTLTSMGERFAMNIKGRSDALDFAVRRFKSKSCLWDKREGRWTFPIREHDTVAQAITALDVVSKVDVVNGFAMRLLRDAAERRCSDAAVEERYQCIPTFLEQKLMDFQKVGVRYMLRLNGRGLIGDEMGLGKTVQALAVAAAYKEQWPCLIITPSLLKLQWADALHQWLRVTEDDVGVVANGKDTRGLGRRFVIINYDLIPKMHAALREQKFKFVICDEAHYIKNHKAKRSKESLPLLQEAEHVVLLSGTPALSRPIELYQQLRAIHPKSVRYLKEYGERYCQVRAQTDVPIG